MLGSWDSGKLKEANRPFPEPGMKSVPAKREGNTLACSPQGKYGTNVTLPFRLRQASGAPGFAAIPSLRSLRSFAAIPVCVLS